MNIKPQTRYAEKLQCEELKWFAILVDLCQAIKKRDSSVYFILFNYPIYY